MILNSIVLISLTAGKYSCNSINRDLIQIPGNDHLHTLLLVDGIENIEVESNQALETQNNRSSSQIPTQIFNVEFDPIIDETNTRYQDLFGNHYSNFAAAYQALHTEYNQRFEDVYNQYLNDINHQQISNSYLSRLNQVYRQYITDVHNQYAAAQNIQAIINEIYSLDDDFDISFLDPLIDQYESLIEDLFTNSINEEHLHIVYDQYMDAIANNQHVCD